MLEEGREVDDINELINDIVEKPKYNTENRIKIKLTDEIISKIQLYLKENEEKRARGQAKQQKRKIDIYESLITDGHDISYPRFSWPVSIGIRMEMWFHLRLKIYFGTI